jgi:hypothetical protein
MKKLTEIIIRMAEDLNRLTIEKQKVTLPINKSAALYGSLSAITVFIIARHWTVF